MVDAALHLPSLSIQNFRGISDLTIERLGRVNLITGKNNTGKSSVLEALRIFTQNAAPRIIHSILRYREEDVRGTTDEERSIDSDGLFQISALFHGFPDLLESHEKIAFSTSGGTSPSWLRMHVDWVTVERGPEGTRFIPAPQHTFFEEQSGIAALVVETEEEQRFYRLEDFSLYPRPSRMARPSEARMPCVLVSSYSAEGTSALGTMWDKVVLTPLEEEVVKALHIIDPEISAASMVGDEGSRRPRKAIVRTGRLDRPVPLRSFGDGLNRLFVIILSLVNASGGLLLVDEFENGLHHTVQLDAWRMIFRLAQDLDIQVFATSHSDDAVKAFQKAAAESSEEGMLIRLTRWGDDIFPTVLEEGELGTATRHGMETR